MDCLVLCLPRPSASDKFDVYVCDMKTDRRNKPEKIDYTTVSIVLFFCWYSIDGPVARSKILMGLWNILVRLRLWPAQPATAKLRRREPWWGTGGLSQKKFGKSALSPRIGVHSRASIWSTSIPIWTLLKTLLSVNFLCGGAILIFEGA